MASRPIQFEYLVDVLKSLPSIGTKVAERIAYFLIQQDERYISEFLCRITNAKQDIHYCQQCNNFCTGDSCTICSNPSRDNGKLCVVNNIDELNKIESTMAFNGLYFILNSEINIRNKSKLPQDTMKKFMSFCTKKKFNEVILATNLTINGEATALFLKKVINELLPKCSVNKLAIGLPANSALDYADSITLKCALNNRTKA